MKPELDAPGALIERTQRGTIDVEPGHHAAALPESRLVHRCGIAGAPGEDARAPRPETKQITGKQVRDAGMEAPRHDMRHDGAIQRCGRFKPAKKIGSPEMLTEQIIEKRFGVAVLIIAEPPEPIAPFRGMERIKGPWTGG